MKQQDQIIKLKIAQLEYVLHLLEKMEKRNKLNKNNNE